MSKRDIKLPEMGEGIIEATITQYLVAVGDTVEVDTPILEVATDKVDSEVLSPFEGTIAELLFEEGDVVPVGDAVARIETEGGENVNSEDKKESEEPKQESEEKQAAQKKENTKYSQFISPTVRALLQQHDLPLGVLDEIEPTGADYRITKQDVENYIAENNLASESKSKKESEKKTEKEPKEEPQKTSSKKVEKPVPKLTVGENDEVVEMGRMRKLIAEHMVDSLATSPHVTSFIEADLTNMVNWRNKVKKEFQEKYGQKLTFTTLFVEVVAKAIKKFPMINISVDGDNIIKRGNVNIGMATALPDGNLIVPVIHKAHQLNIVGIAEQVNTLAEKARNNKLAPTDIKGGTFTITNLGAFDSLTGTPIINQPEVAILAVGAIKKKPAAVLSDNGNYGVGIRDIMMLAMSYDHRVVDGGLGGNFLKEVRDQLENFDVNRSI
ncbi:2-oxoglutarate dehydrogenase E2 component (dihydrolipoamide succinyltransferase) [Balneicella halophila]|uniref:Dihydrolipoamide acetyltransferase component of pyruvate dehydrogenase complex n=1 Tax=Balneicella halophila TaxID=1537566 RepID=A0A7L4UQH6_BALHA|nr:dihydrolipoamide acetyltransferase family protein [Balneicella halophila]PVX51066.1 2-oxoglutarate dehydrogenase E2 component (dihydrolipoamide succinyltransferase) [Balneicella halophila]